MNINTNQQQSLTLGENDTTTFGLKNALANYVAQASTNTLDSRFDFADENLAPLKNIFKKSDFPTMIARRGYDLSICGEYWLAPIQIEKDWVLLTFNRADVSYTTFLRDVSDITLTSNINVLNEDKQVALSFHFRVLPEGTQNSKGKNIGGRVEVVTGFIDGNSFKEFGKDSKATSQRWLYPKKFKKVPAAPVRNNQNSWGDLVRVEQMINQTHLLLDKLPEEYEYLKTLFTSNDNYGTGEGVNKIINAIKKGGREVPNGDSGNGKFAGTFGLFSQGGTTLEILLTTIGSINDLVFKLSLTGRDSDSSGTNKHGSEIALFNQSASEYIETKRRQRVEDLSYFMVEFMPLVVPSFTPSEDYKITLNESDYEEGKREKLKQTKHENDKLESETTKNGGLNEKALGEANQANANAEQTKNAPQETTNPTQI